MTPWRMMRSKLASAPREGGGFSFFIRVLVRISTQSYAEITKAIVEINDLGRTQFGRDERRESGTPQRKVNIGDSRSSSLPNAGWRGLRILSCAWPAILWLSYLAHWRAGRCDTSGRWTRWRWGRRS